ncbi:hypothetical protein TI39_contig1183g00001 [Zymoseptoria brevis]|uniref:ABA 3 protein n=1 Tax=Zymoseptoria brevis TaxID=1047168 RepID=A0A0F4GE55_9PEZI|nr:hypothetical protein TI39_contig1183g00001 [Zymoseptoria brevis]
MEQPRSVKNKWYYPQAIADDLRGVNLPAAVKEETLACAWEYTRCVIPHYTNWSRYVAFMRTIIIGTIAEFQGSLLDVAAGDEILGYDLGQVLDDLFHDTAAHQEMSREYRSFLLITADKTHSRRAGRFFKQYVRALAETPRQWFRMRDADALARFSMAAALACNDLDTDCLSPAQTEIMAEIAVTLYDATAFFKHRAERETNNTFAYVPADGRLEAFHQARQVLWALDVGYASKPGFHVICNFVRSFGGPIHMEMRRYRYVEDGLTIGRAETQKVVEAARSHVKLWNRVESDHDSNEDLRRYEAVLQREDLLFDGLAGFLQRGPSCMHCKYRTDSGEMYQFSGIELCASCRIEWQAHVRSLPERALCVFPEPACTAFNERRQMTDYMNSIDQSTEQALKL